jgi:hypothetical protein
MFWQTAFESVPGASGFPSQVLRLIAIWSWAWREGSQMVSLSLTEETLNLTWYIHVNFSAKYRGLSIFLGIKLSLEEAMSLPTITMHNQVQRICQADCYQNKKPSL